MTKKTDFLLSTDTLTWYGLDLIFDTAVQAAFDGLDLAMRKSFDARNADYIAKLSKKHNMPVKVIQVSNKANTKELNQALDLCAATWARQITINAPDFFDLWVYNFLIDNLPSYRDHNKDITFSIINPPQSNFFALPIPKYRFANIVEIIKKYWCHLWLDIVNIPEEALENDLLRKLDKFVPYMSVIYFSDKTKLWKWHVLPWDGTLKLTSILKKLSKENFSWSLSLKIDIEKSDLADSDKVALILKKATTFHKDYYDSLS